MRITKFNFSVIIFNQPSVGSTVISITFVLGILENTSSLNHTRKSNLFYLSTFTRKREEDTNYDI